MHIILHIVVPIALALACYRPRWRSAALVMLATIVVDADHLLADPIYDPERCSIGFHPLHTAPAIAAYVLMVVAPLLLRGPAAVRYATATRVAHLAGLGLLIHMALDAIDCVT